MRRLAISLLLVVLAATLGAGWALDRLFAGLGETDGANSERLDAWRHLGRALTDTAAATDDPVATLRALAPDHDVALVRADELGLDDAALRSALAERRGLALESARGVTVYYALDGGDDVLALRHPELPAAPVPQLLLTLGFYVALLMLVGLWLLPLIRRLGRLARASEAFGRGHLEARVPTRKGSDLHAVESAFNAMAARIGRLVDDNRLLARGVAHDLKTPLARLRFGIDSLEELGTPANDPERHRDHLHRLQADLDAMEDSLDAMLGYARFELRETGEPHRSVDLAALVADRVAARGDRPGIAFEPGEVIREVRGDDRELATLVDNLLQNASRYGRGRVRVTLAGGTARGVTLGVEDDGEGIPPARREGVLTPFVRDVPDDGRANGRAAGHGLGLALVARIAERHGADVSIGTSEALGGARVQVRFAADRGT